MCALIQIGLVFGIDVPYTIIRTRTCYCKCVCAIVYIYMHLPQLHEHNEMNIRLGNNYSDWLSKHNFVVGIVIHVCTQL